MSSFLQGANTLFVALAVAALLPNAVALALPARSVASLVVGFAAAIFTFAIAALIGSFLVLAPAVVIAVLVAREWSYRWCLVSLPVVAVAYFLFELVRPVGWPFLLLTLCAYAIPLWAHLRRRRRAASPV